MKSLFAIIAVLYVSSTFSQKKECDCYKYYTGTFYTEPLEGLLDTVIIERNKTVQYEYEIGKKSEKHTLNVIWLSDCKYILRDPKKQGSKEAKFLPTDVIVQIIETTDTYYVSKVKVYGSPKMIIKLYAYKPE